jgi:hypothetical protein
LSGTINKSVSRDVLCFPLNLLNYHYFARRASRSMDYLKFIDVWIDTEKNPACQGVKLEAELALGRLLSTHCITCG